MASPPSARLILISQATTWTTSSRPLTPDGAVAANSASSGGFGAASSPPWIQQPTRSLWIGKLDPRTTSGELQAVFAPYGAIESLRLIPEKVSYGRASSGSSGTDFSRQQECGFINFVSVNDAIRARDDVLNRLGGQLSLTSGVIRIGFGKDAALAGPASSLAHMRTAAGPVVMGSHPQSTNGAGSDMSLQTAPTRALWIGSIPSS